ncbi:hypothetical protein HanIR_Chr15g0777091 [Helianthus annuus]|nr:hypothetical protein HanIR_Chr15g0777091 [Helianthus annuus]
MKTLLMDLVNPKPICHRGLHCGCRRPKPITTTVYAGNVIPHFHPNHLLHYRQKLRRRKFIFRCTHRRRRRQRRP